MIGQRIGAKLLKSKQVKSDVAWNSLKKSSEEIASTIKPQLQNATERNH